MNRNKTFIAAAVIVGAIVAAIVIVAACAKKTGPTETAATSDHGRQTVPGALHGTIRTRDGQPAPRVLVTATSLDNPQHPVPEIAVITDSDGRYEWPLPSGRYRISADIPDAGTATAETDIRAEGPNELDVAVPG